MPASSARFSSLRVGLDVGIVDDEHVRLLGDQRGDRLRAGVGAEMRIADFELHAEAVGLFLHDRRPALGEVDAHRDRHEGDRLAREVLEIVGAPGIVDAVGHGVGGHARQRRGRTRTPPRYVSFACFVSLLSCGALDVALLRGLFVARIDDAVEHDRVSGSTPITLLTSCRRSKRNSRPSWRPRRPCTRRAADTGRAAAASRFPSTRRRRRTSSR